MSAKRVLDLRLYGVTSGDDQHTVDAAAACATAGAGIVQVRLKDASTRALYDLVARVAPAVHAANPATAVVVDDRIDVVLAARLAGLPVDGVHLGAEDLPPSVARDLLGPDAIVGWTTGTLELVEQAEREFADVVDYLGAGPFRPTPTKDSGRAPLGLAGYPPLVAATRLPIVAIGDVQPLDVAALASTGVAGVAMVRALMTASDPGAVARQALADWDAGQTERSWAN